MEWSQELKLEQSLREYVGAVMFIEILKASKLLGEDFSPGETVFDMSVGYNLEGIRSPRVRSWIESMKDASAVIDELRAGLTAAIGICRSPRASATPSASRRSTAVPRREIEGIVTFLLTELGCNVCIKMNPTLLGAGEVEHLLHDVLGYREIQLSPEAFEKDLQFDEALDLVPRLQRWRKPMGSTGGEVQQHAGGEESQVVLHRRDDVHVRPAAARDRHEPGEEVSGAHEDQHPDFFFGGSGCAQYRHRGGSEYGPGDYVHGPACGRAATRG